MSLPPSPRIALVEDHSLFADSLRLALKLEGFDARRVPLEASGGSRTRLAAAIARLRPAITLLDLDLGEFGRGTDLIQPLMLSRIAVVIVTSSTDRARWGECISCGARTVVPKSAALSEIVTTMTRICDGLPVLSSEQRATLIAEWHRDIATTREIQSRLDHLTRSEALVLGELMAGLQVSDISRDRFVSESTVRTQVKSILAKLQVGSQLAAVGLAHRAGWRPSTGVNAPGRPGTYV